MALKQVMEYVQTLKAQAAGGLVKPVIDVGKSSIAANDATSITSPGTSEVGFTQSVETPHLCDSSTVGLLGTSTPQPAPNHKLWMDSQQPLDIPTSFNGGSKASQSRTLYTTGDWRPLAQAYHAHHFGCPVCVSAGLGYGLRCGAGAALWVAYSDAA